MVPLPMALSDLEWLSEIFNDKATGGLSATAELLDIICPCVTA